MVIRILFGRFSLGFVTIWVLNNILLSPAFAQPGGYGNGHMGRWMMGDWGMGWFGKIFMLLFWALVIAGIVFPIRWLVKSTDSRNRSRSNAGTGFQAMDILKERYAKGEISQDEFESMKKEILRWACGRLAMKKKSTGMTNQRFLFETITWVKEPM